MQKVSDYFSKLNRQQKTMLQIILDVSLLTVSFLGTMFIGLESLDFVGQLPILGVFFSSVFATIIAFWGLGVYQVIVRFLTGKVLVVIGKGAVVAGISLYAAGLLFDANLPLSVPCLFAVFVFLSIGGLRFGARKYRQC